MKQKNKMEISIQAQPVVMAVLLSKETQKERIIIGTEPEVRSYLEGKLSKGDLYDRERPIGQLLFDYERECVEEWNEKVIYEMEKALRCAFSKTNSERKAMAFLREKLELENAISTFWAQNCLRIYTRCKNMLSAERRGRIFEEEMLSMTRLCKNNILGKDVDYAIGDAAINAQEIMRYCGYQQDAVVQIWYPCRRNHMECIVIRESIMAGIMFYINRLCDWDGRCRICENCGRWFVALNAHCNLCSDSCKKERNRSSKRDYDQRAKQNRYDLDYKNTTQRMRNLLNRKKEKELVTEDEYIKAYAFYKQICKEAQSRKKQIKTQEQYKAFVDWLFEQERQLEDILGGAK